MKINTKTTHFVIDEHELMDDDSGKYNRDELVQKIDEAVAIVPIEFRETLKFRIEKDEIDYEYSEHTSIKATLKYTYTRPETTEETQKRALAIKKQIKII